MTQDECKALAARLFPDVTGTPEDLERRYPPRGLPDSARVTRFAPSPTGYLHLGGLFGALCDIQTAKATGGVSYLRIEDTDKKREIDDGVSAITEGFAGFGLSFDEGVTGFGTEKGDYGPYTQSRRVEIYHTMAKHLVELGMAYPCFCTAQELDDMRQRQEAAGADIRGYFGEWARCRCLTCEQIEANLAAGKPWVLRFRSPGDPQKRIAFDDLIRGRIEMPENIQDEVLLKTDGIPTYHFAHVCDDHFMRTTHVIRAEEWISSVPKHIQMFKACAFRVPKYAHTPQVMKLDEEDGTKRKLSKRKDPEAAVSWFTETGFPPEAVIEYLLTLMNSTFEDWRRANPDANALDYKFDLKKMSVSGCLFDMAKLRDISKTVISKMTAGDVYDAVIDWAKTRDAALYDAFTADPDRAKAILNIDRETKKPRKDIACWQEVRDYVAYFYDGLYEPDTAMPENIAGEDADAILDAFAAVYDPADDKDAWFAKIKALCEPLGFTPNVKEYKKDPTAYKGHVGDVSTVLRVAVTGRTNTPDLCEIMRILGKETVLARLAAAKKG